MKAEDWKTLNISDALNGRRVGFENLENANDILKTGQVISMGTDKDPTAGVHKMIYKTIIDGYQVFFDDSGVVTKTIPENAEMTGKTIKMVETTIPETMGSMVKPYAAPGEDSEEVDLSEMEPRDEFALKVLGELIGKMPHPESADDANILFTCRAAYRWANGMMTAAADARLGTLQEYEEVERKSGNVKVNVSITNNSSSEITIAPQFRFVLSTEGTKQSNPYNRTEAASLGSNSITIGAGQTQTFQNVTVPGNSKQYIGQHFAESNEIAGFWPNNVLLYDSTGNSGTIVPNMINPSTLFADGATYAIVYGSASAGQEDPEPLQNPEPLSDPS